MKSMPLVVLEFKEEAQYLYQQHPELFNGNARVISLLPEASEYLLAKGIAFETSLEYLNISSREICLERVDQIINLFSQELRIYDSNNIQHAYNNTLIFYLRPYLNYIFFILEVVTKACERWPVETIWACRYDGCDYSQFDLMSKERISGDILEAMPLPISKNIVTVDLPKTVKPNRWRKWMRSLVCLTLFPLELSLIKKQTSPALVYYSYKYRFDHIAKAFKNCSHYNLVPEAKTFFKLKDLSLGFTSHQIHLKDLVFLNDSLFMQSWQDSLARVKRICEERKFLIYRGCDLAPMIDRKMEFGFKPEMIRLNQRIKSLKKFLIRLKPTVVLSHVAREFSYALGELAESLNIPSILISHGSHVPAKNRFDYMEWFDHGKGMVNTDYRYHLLQSPWAVEHVLSMGYQGQYYAIEPIIFPTVDRSVKNELQLKMFPQSQGKKVVIHAGTPKPRGSNRFYIYETLDEYVAYISDLIVEARKIPDIFLVIRFRPYAYLSTAQLKALLPPGDDYVIATEGSFADYLKIADLMVSFSSTTIEEALINQIPVLQYDPTRRYVHIEGASWQEKEFAHADSVYYIGCRSGLGPGLQWIVKNHLYCKVGSELFMRHRFKTGEALSVQGFIQNLINNQLPQPLDLTVKPQLSRMGMPVIR